MWRVRNAKVRQYTKVNEGRISAARLDRLYVSERYCRRFGRCDITPVRFSDHHIFTVDIHLSCPRRWYFNVKLLHDAKFCEMFCERFLMFWENGVLQKGILSP